MNLANTIRDELFLGAREPRAWCLCRWTEDGLFCGPLSPNSGTHVNMGFPLGQIGRVALFDSEEEAGKVAAVSAGRIRAYDVPTRLTDLHFSVRVYSYWDGKEAVIYDGGELQQALDTSDLATGRAAKAGAEHQYKVMVECRFLGKSPPRRLVGAVPELPVVST
jgi:hypothetical protein